MATWLKHLATGTLLTTLALGCKFGELDDDEVFDDGTGGSGRAGTSAGGSSARAGAGGSRAGSAGSGGSRAGAGGSAMAGSGAGSGGTTGDDDIPGDVSCSDPMGTEPAPSCEFDDPLPEDEACLTCLSGSCCVELKDCYATDPHDRCGWGPAPDGREEYMCYMDCLVDVARSSETKIYTSDDKADCASECATGVDGTGRECSALIGDRTNELLNCMENNCDLECLQDRIDAP